MTATYIRVGNNLYNATLFENVFLCEHKDHTWSLSAWLQGDKDMITLLCCKSPVDAQKAFEEYVQCVIYGKHFVNLTEYAQKDDDTLDLLQ